MTETIIVETASQWQRLAGYLQTVYDRNIDVSGLSDQINRITNEKGPTALVANAVGNAFDMDAVRFEGEDFGVLKFGKPLVSWDTAGNPFVIVGRSIRRKFTILTFENGDGPTEAVLTKSELLSRFSAGSVFEERLAFDVWDADSDHVEGSRWFWASIKPLKSAAKYLIIAAIVGNTLAVCVSLFALQVWDRVIPANSLNSLAVLMIGVFLAIAFELVLRLQRAALIDEVGMDVDRSISGAVFAQMLGLQPDSRPQSLGSLATQLREINQIREAFSSSMLSAIIDLPFSLIFVVVIFFISPQLTIPIIGAMVLVLVVCLFAQFPLARLAKEGLEEASVRNGLIVETVMKADELKLQQAEPTMQIRWNRVVDTANQVGNRQRRLRNFLTNATQSMQQGAYILVVSYGALLVISGDLTMGQVIACSILTNRAIAPMTQVSNVMGALQGSIIAKSSIDELMKRPNDLPTRNHLRRELAAPAYVFKNVRYNYPETERGALILPMVEIPFGSKIGVLGRVGSGKSTLLRVLSGLARPSQGTVTLDGADITAIHPEDLRKAVGFQSQSATLLRGTVRDNLLIARPSATEADMIEACKISGASDLVTKNPRGLDLQINEAGEGLSGGQRQSLLLARTVLRNPAIALFDEPTASMDQQSEANFITALSEWGAGKTMILATHRMPPLQLCNRLIVVSEGRIAIDGDKDTVMAKLRNGGVTG